MITFYSMNGCGFCNKSKTLLADQLENKVVVIKDKKDAPAGVRGYPYFVNELNGKTHTGYPGTVDKLFTVLEFEVPVEEVVEAEIASMPELLPAEEEIITENFRQGPKDAVVGTAYDYSVGVL